MANEPSLAAERRALAIRRRNAPGDHEGSPHAPEEFDVMNPAKVVPGASGRPATEGDESDGAE